MRTSLLLVISALLAFSTAFGTVAAGPAKDVPPATSGGAKGRGASTDKFQVSFTSEFGGDWTCSGIHVKNKNHSRVNVQCTFSDIGTLPAGTYSSATHSIPVSVAGELGALEATSGWTLADWSFVVTHSGNGAGHVSGTACLD